MTCFDGSYALFAFLLFYSALKCYNGFIRFLECLRKNGNNQY